jgi:hypothetical protein
MNDQQLSELTLLELQELHAQLHSAIRKAIREQQEAMASRRQPHRSSVEPSRSVDLAKERDAWLARRRNGIPA